MRFLGWFFIFQVGLCHLCYAMPESECPALLRILGKKQRTQYENYIRSALVAIQAGHEDEISLHIGQLEEVHNTSIMRHLTLLLPIAMIQFPHRVDLIERLVISLRRQEWTLLKTYSDGNLPSEEAFNAFLSSFEELNYLRLAGITKSDLEGFLDSLCASEIYYGDELWTRHLLKSYLKLRDSLSFSTPPKFDSNSPSALKDVLLADFQSEPDRDFAFFYAHAIYLQAEYASHPESAFYSQIGRIWEETRALPGPSIEADRILAWLDELDLLDSEGDELEDEIDYAAIAGFKDLEREDHSYLGSLLNRLYNIPEQPIDIEWNEILSQADFDPEQLVRAYRIEDEDSEPALFLTPLQVFVLTGYDALANDLQQYLRANASQYSSWSLTPHSFPYAAP